MPQLIFCLGQWQTGLGLDRRANHFSPGRLKDGGCPAQIYVFKSGALQLFWCMLYVTVDVSYPANLASKFRQLSLNYCVHGALCGGGASKPPSLFQALVHTVQRPERRGVDG